MAHETKLDGNLWLNIDSNSFMGHGRIELLERIDSTGSISKAAKEMKMSYKAAWDAVDAMNNVAKEPIVSRETGGRGGGGTRLTEYGKELISVYKEAEKEHLRFLNNLTEKVRNFNDHAAFFQRMSMKTSARNQYGGTISSITRGPISSEVGITVGEGTVIFANVTNESIEELNLKEGMEAFALVKSSWITLVAPECANKVSARNRLCGEVESFNTGAINSEVIIQLNDKNTITATITNASAKEMELHLGSKICAVFKSNSVILGI